ncbi:hypothetical protein OSTOST_15135, partial [Ostertagia ostertagi]
LSSHVFFFSPDQIQKARVLAPEKVAPTNYQALAEKPQFSLKQVRMICELLLKKQEMRLRYEYELALNQKLDEQHEQYVQFASEQMTAQFKENTAGSCFTTCALL